MAESKRLHATRIKGVPKGTVQFQVALKATYEGIKMEGAEIECSHSDVPSPISISDQIGNLSIKIGTPVSFKMVENRRNKVAVEVGVVNYIDASFRRVGSFVQNLPLELFFKRRTSYHFKAYVHNPGFLTNFFYFFYQSSAKNV